MAITKDITNGSGSEFYFNAWNGTNGYTLDLDLTTALGDWIGTDPFFGQTGQTTIDAAAVPASQITSGVIYDGELTGFSDAFASDAGIEWTLVAYDNIGFQRSIVTADNSITPGTLSNEQAAELAGTLDNMASTVNGFARTADDDTYHVTAATDGAAYAGNFGPTYQGNVFDTSNVLVDNTSANLYMVTKSTDAPNFAARDGITHQIADTNGKAITATVYQDTGVWKLKVEVGANDAATTTYTQPVFSTINSNIDSIVTVGNDLHLVGADGNNDIIPANGTETVISFKDAVVNKADLLASAQAAVTFTDGNGDIVVPTKYIGTLNIDVELLGTNSAEAIEGAASNDFMNLFGGDDAANGGAGDDVLDGGLGSNFLAGGTGNDIFFLDGRPQNGVQNTTWSTITDFTAGDTVNLWGWIDGTSQLLLTDPNGGIGAFTGYTLHYDLDGDNGIDTSVTFTGLTADTAPTGTPLAIGDLGFLNFA